MFRYLSLWERGKFYCWYLSKKGEVISSKSLELKFLSLVIWLTRESVLCKSNLALKICNDGCRRISSMLGLSFTLWLIIKFINVSSIWDLWALGENCILPYLSFYQPTPFWGKFIPEASSSKVAPKLKISAFVEMWEELF